MGVVPVSIVSSLKNWGTFVLLLLILAVGLGNWLNPRNPTITPKTVENLQQVADQMKRVADNMEANSNATSALTQTLATQLNQRAVEQDKLTDELLARYGLDLSEPAIVPAVGGLYPAPVYIGSGQLPASPSGKGADGRDAKAAPVFPRQTDSYTAPAVESSLGDASKSAG